MTAPDQPERRNRSSDPLIDELFQTANALRIFVDGRLASHGLSVARLRALRALASAPEPPRPSDLGAVLGIAARTVTSMVDALAREGLVVRLPHPSDRRAHLLALTPEGERLHTEAERLDRAALATATAALTPADRARLRELLGTLRDTARAATKDDAGKAAGKAAPRAAGKPAAEAAGGAPARAASGTAAG
jgi:DNA-binding MarR family transcriptional regulator